MISNSIVVTNPELAKEWNYGKNGLLKPEMFTICRCIGVPVFLRCVGILALAKAKEPG